MKKTIKIKIGGVVFHIDDDAYDMLKEYLNSLNDHFKGMEGGTEVIDDIETRIAEIFEQKVGDQKEVIDKNDVVSMIEIMGEAKDIIEEEEPFTPGSQKTYSRTGKRLYRDPDSAILGGVCGGLGAYFNVDPVWFRILFIILVFAYGFGLVYIILWIVLPKAETTTQKLEMKGQNVTVQNIERSLKEEYESVKGNFRKMKDSRAYNRSTEAVNEVFRGIGNIILIFLKLILMIIGIVLIIAGFSVLIAVLGALLFSNVLFFPDIFDVPRFYLPHILPIFTAQANVPFVLIALMLTIMIPLIALIYGGIKLIFRFKVNDKVIGLIAFIIWFISLAGLATVVAFEGANFDERARITNTYQLEDTQSNTLYLQINDLPDFAEQMEFVSIEIENEGIYRDPNTGTIYGKPGLDIVKSESGEVELELRKRSRGRNSQIAWEHARELEYYWDQKDSLVIFDPYFKLPDGQRWRDPSVRLRLKLPEGKSVYFEDGMTRIIHNIRNITHTWDYDMIGKVWTMTDEGLEEVVESPE